MCLSVSRTHIRLRRPGKSTAWDRFCRSVICKSSALTVIQERRSYFSHAGTATSPPPNPAPAPRRSSQSDQPDLPSCKPPNSTSNRNGARGTRPASLIIERVPARPPTISTTSTGRPQVGSQPPDICNLTAKIREHRSNTYPHVKQGESVSRR